MMRLCLILVFVSQTCGDIYLHNMRGSNNRLGEKSATRANDKRMFDSQNNNRGGYNVGDATDTPYGTDEGKQYRMKYFQSGPVKTLQNGAGESRLVLEWTNQHGCGGNEDDSPQKQNCALILQYLCQDDVDTPTGSADTLRNGVKTQTQDYKKPDSLTESKSDSQTRKNDAVKSDRGLHESWAWYDKCYLRERNKGLFTADQKLKTNNGLGYSSATYTRQNPQGNRYGYECPEERDYFPYWHPTPWKDIAVMAENASMCSYYQTHSFNVQPKSECVEMYPDNTRRHFSRWNNQAECVANGGQWVELHNYLEKAPQFTSESACRNARSAGLTYVWAVPYDAEVVTVKQCLVQLSRPDCSEAPWSRSNHLGNGVDGEPLNYTWVLPHFPSGKTKRCVFRIRYNISTDDYDPYHTDSKYNGNMSPVKGNPYVDIGVGRSPLRLNINTNQYGRIFQDRSHVFLLRPRPAGMQNDIIHNLNVRGKRGNIVQVYPAVEYDFVPNYLRMKTGELVHIQWTGSNTHKNGPNGGDGQTGDDGEGRTATDRNNLVEIFDRNDNFPIPFERSTMWTGADIKWIYHGKTSVSAKNLAVNMASSGYYRCIKTADCSEPAHRDYTVESRDKLHNQLNNAPASYEGAVVKFRQGTYHYMCTRNNNFTNRSQKGTIIVS
ncbi:protein DD3-3-like [Haliotis asinina]|uniref:protein DD3-3-like n=1 Tax=Haliotis asinina TaxID=109174 RepID=UPI003531BC06